LVLKVFVVQYFVVVKVFFGWLSANQRQIHYRANSLRTISLKYGIMKATQRHLFMRYSNKTFKLFSLQQKLKLFWSVSLLGLVFFTTVKIPLVLC